MRDFDIDPTVKWEEVGENQYLLYYIPSDNTPKILIGEAYESAVGTYRWSCKLTDNRSSENTLYEAMMQVLTSCSKEMERLRREYQIR